MKLKINRFSVASPTFFGDTGTTNGNTTKIAIGMDAWAVGTTVYVKPYLYASQASWAQNGSKKTVTIGSFYKETAATNLWPNNTNNFKSSGRSDVYKLYVDYPWIETSYEFSSSQVGRIYVECSFTGNTTASYAPKKGVTLKVSGYITTAVVPSGLTCSVTSYSDTTATLSGNYSNDGGASVTASGYQYKVDGGSWANCSSSLSNLTPNTKYYFRYYATNIAGTAYSAETSITTYDYPKVVNISTSDLKIGDTQTVYIYNPTGKAITLYMKKDTVNGTTLYSQSFDANAIKGTNVAYTFTPSATTLYNSIPDAPSATAYYMISQTGSGYVKSGTYSVVGTETPTFSSSNFTCSTNLTALTGDTNTIIPGKSTVTATITSAGTPKNGASISKYVVSWGSNSVEITELDTPTQLTNGTGNNVIISCIDSRGLSTPIQVPLEVVNYNAPTVDGTANRQNGVDTDVFLDLNGNLFYDTFGDNGVSNAIYSIKYRVSTTNTFSGNGYPINVSHVTYGTGTENKRSWSLNNEQIFSDGQSAGFTIGTRYYVEISIQDARGLLGTVTLPLVQISDGKIARDVYQDNNGEYHVGFNGLADSNYAMKIHGDFDVEGRIYRNGTELPEPPNVRTSKTTSDTDTYSCTYVNDKIKTSTTTSNDDTYACTYINGLVATDAIEIGISARYNYTSTSWQNTIINYNTTKQSTGSKLTRSGNGVKIGAGVSKVLCIGIADTSTTNGNTNYEQDTGFIISSTKYGHTYDSPSGGLDTHTIATIISVNQGDVIQHYMNTGGTLAITVYEQSKFIVIALK